MALLNNLKDLFKADVLNKYGWKPQLPDQRDYTYSLGNANVAAFPSKLDLRDTGFMPPVYDQGALGSCVGNAIASNVEFLLKKEKKVDFTPSRLFI